MSWTEPLHLPIADSNRVLAVLEQTPNEALQSFMEKNPWYDCAANREIISKRIIRTHESVGQAVAALANQLAFNREIADANRVRKEADERAALIEEIVLDYSPVPHAQQLHRHKLRGVPTSNLQTMAEEIRDRKRFRQMSKDELKKYLRQQREQNTPAALELPAEFTPEKIRNLSVEDIKNLNRVYGRDVVNQRLGYIKPEIGGLVRTVSVEI